MHSIKFRVLTKFKPLRLLEFNGRVPKSHSFHGLPPSHNYLPVNPSQGVILSQKFTLTRIDHQWIRTHIGHSPFNRPNLINPRDEKKIDYFCKPHGPEFLLCTKDHKKLLLRCSSSGSGDSNKDSTDKLKSSCVKRKPVEKLSKHNESYVHQEIIKDLKKRKGVNRRKCGKTPEELRKCIRTFQDVVDCVHPVVPHFPLPIQTLLHFNNKSNI